MCVSMKHINLLNSSTFNFFNANNEVLFHYRSLIIYYLSNFLRKLDLFKILYSTIPIVFFIKTF